MTDKGPANLSCRIHARRVGFGSTIEILWRERQIGRCRHGASFALYVVGVCLNRIGTVQPIRLWSMAEYLLACRRPKATVASDYGRIAKPTSCDARHPIPLRRVRP